MKRKTIVLLLVVVISALVLAACGSTAADDKTAEVIPADYASKTNPLAGNADAATAGAAIYAERCASCHGDTGAGDGAAAAALDPKPAKLAGAGNSEALTYWRIAEGGAMEPFNSSMPAHKSVLSEEQIWQVVTFVNTLK